MENSDTSTICLFDVDGTLTPSRKKVSPEMATFLQKLRNKVKVALVGGSDLVKITEQMGEGSDVESKFDYVFSENGLVAFKNGEQILKEIFTLKFTLREICRSNGGILLKVENGSERKNILKVKGEELLQRVINFALRYMSELELPAKRGTFVEFRSSMLNLCPVGRSCTQEERDQFSEFDKKHNVRQKFVDALYGKFGDDGLKFAIGGQISIDVFPVGWDKTFCLPTLQKDGFKTIHFFGDKTDKGGNDHEIYEDSRTIGHKVTGPDDTIKQVSELFFK